MSLDLLRGPDNVSIDLMRVGGASALVIYPFPFLWNVIAHGIVPDPSAFGIGYAAVIGAVAAAIGTKDLMLAKASAAGAANASP